MLEPHSRRLLLDSLHAPEGHRLDFAVGTTYTLDLVALLAASVAFAFSDWQDRDGRPTLEPLALLKAVRQYADHVCLFCQAGKIAAPRAYQPLLASLEDSVVEAVAPRGGSFHPKLWFLRYAADDGSVTYRFLCLSRNMTFDRSWDTMLCLEGLLRDRVNAFGQNHPLGDFVAALPTLAPRGLAPLWQQRVEQLAHELRRVEFEVPAPFTDYAFWPLGVSEPSNPVDLEQREGRVHRYKGHALRRNIAVGFSATARCGKPDPWSAMFEAARQSRSPGQNELFPFWIAPFGPAKIERHVPAYPHSREVLRHENLRRALAGFLGLGDLEAGARRRLKEGRCG
jgi:hypothetical protein